MKDKTNRIKGKITVNSLGSGYVSSDLIEEDIYIPSQFLNTTKSENWRYLLNEIRTYFEENSE